MPPSYEPRRNSTPFVIGGIIMTALLHLAVIGGFWLARARAEAAPPLGPGTFVDAQLVKFGKPRDLSFLPHKQGQVKTVGPPTGLKIATDAKALPHLDKDDKPPDKTDPLKNTHAEMFKNLTDQPEGVDTSGEGSLTGSKAGTATEAKGDPYILSLIDQIGTAWQVPTTIKDSDLQKLSAEVCLTIDASGALTHYEFTQRSGNSQFDSSLEATLSTTKKVPPPPDRFQSAAARGRLCPVFSKR
jgi:TonB C terminal